MDTQQFREFAKASVDFIADYMESLRDRPVISSVTPGYIKDLIPDEAPQYGESWQEVLKDVERIIVPGLTHWQSPHFHAYYPAAHSFPGIVGEMLSAGFGCVGLSWMASPVYTELEVAMMNWLGKLLNLPKEFLNCSDGPGGGVIQGSASEATLVALLAAKEKKVREMCETDPTSSEGEVKKKKKLVAYSSDQSNSCVEKAGLLGSMPMRLLKSDENGVLRGSTLLKAIREDKEKGLIPCYVVANLGITSTCAFDNLEEIGPVCKQEDVWLHIDAAYAGTAFICPEYQYLMKGVEYSDSFNFNPHKWILVSFDCSAMWVKDAKYLVEAFSVDRTYLKVRNQGLAPEYSDWQMSSERRFRALKLWFVLRIYDIEGIRKHVRNHIALAKRFEYHVKRDNRFEHCCTSMGLVCFKLKGTEKENHDLLERITARKKIFLIAGNFRDQYCIRFVVCSPQCNENDIDFAWDEIVLRLKRKICQNTAFK